MQKTINIDMIKWSNMFCQYKNRGFSYYKLGNYASYGKKFGKKVLLVIYCIISC